MADQKSILIIGGGIAGLAAGCYGQMSGFRTRIFEMHKKPGGLCTCWKRQGFVVNGSIHWLIGTNPRSGFYRIWKDLGALEGKTVIDFDEYGRFEGHGQTFVIYTDLDRLERHMKELAPEDHAVIDELISAARGCTRLEPPMEKAPEISTLFDFLRLVVTRYPLLRMLRKWNTVSLTQFGSRFKNPLIREAFPLLFMPDFPMSFMLMTLGWLHNRAAGYPLGGSLEFSRAIEKRYLSLAGEAVYRAKVVKILTENGRATGIRLADGTEHHADYVISAADGHATIFEMLEGKYADEVIRGYYDRLLPFPPLVYIALGVNRTFPELPPMAAGFGIRLQEPIMVGTVRHEYLGVKIYNFDPALAPDGKTLLTLLLPTDYISWKRLKQDDARYKAEKERIADLVVGLLDKRFPGLATQVEMRDVATPTTFERYTGNWKGSFEGWQVTPGTWSLGRVMRKTLPGLENFYMAGQWVEPGGGISTAAMSGRNVIQIICKKEKKKFRSGS